MRRRLLYRRRPWYAREFPSGRELSRACQAFYARTVRWMREPLRPSGPLRGKDLRLRKIPRKSLLRVAEVCLWIVAIGALGFCSLAYGSAAIYQARQKAILASLRANASAHAELRSGLRVSSSKPANEVLLGLIEIPRLDTAAIVAEGVSAGTLWKAVGHLPGTALPGQTGNAVLAGHRDTYFSGLGDLKTGDLVSFKSPTATYSYRVESARVVESDDDSVLSASKEATLTLITCYPFHYIGSAPQRYVVTAREVPMPASE